MGSLVYIWVLYYPGCQYILYTQHILGTLCIVMCISNGWKTVEQRLQFWISLRIFQFTEEVKISCNIELESSIHGWRRVSTTTRTRHSAYTGWITHGINTTIICLIIYYAEVFKTFWGHMKPFLKGKLFLFSLELSSVCL